MDAPTSGRRSRGAARLLAGLSLAIGLWAAAPEEASACIYGGCEGIAIAGISLGVAVGLADLTLLGADIAHGAQGEWAPPELASAELAFGIAHLLLGAAMAGIGADLGAAVAGVGWALLALGALFTLHGSLSMSLYEDPGPPRSPDPAPLRVPVGAGFGGEF